MTDLEEAIGSIPLASIVGFFLALAVVTLIAYYGYRASKAFLLRYTSRASARWAARFMGYLIFIVLLYAADLFILGFDLKATLASLGIISIALAFASQQIISNLFAGLLITVNRTIRLDDWIELGGDPATGIARVRDLTLTRTVIEDRDGRALSIPNATLLSSKIVNYSKSGYIEVATEISLPLSIPFERAQKTILAVLATMPGILPQASQADSSVQEPGIRSSYFFQGYTGKRIHPEHLTPRVLATSISHVAISLSIRFWIADVTRKEEIVSAVLAETGKRLDLPDLG